MDGVYLREKMFEHPECARLAAVVELIDLVNEERLRMNACQRVELIGGRMYWTHDGSTSTCGLERVGRRTRSIGRADGELRVILGRAHALTRGQATPCEETVPNRPKQARQVPSECGRVPTCSATRNTT